MEKYLDKSEVQFRSIQEMVPGKQVTLAHVIASPDPIIYKKLGLNPEIDYKRAAIGILSMCPSEVSVIAGDIAMKTSAIDMGFIDRFAGTLIYTGTVGNVDAAMNAILVYMHDELNFTICDKTRT